MSFKKWVRAVQFEFHCGERTRREACGATGRDPISDTRLHLWFLGRVGSPCGGIRTPNSYAHFFTGVSLRTTRSNFFRAGLRAPPPTAMASSDLRRLEIGNVVIELPPSVKVTYGEGGRAELHLNAFTGSLTVLPSAASMSVKRAAASIDSEEDFAKRSRLETPVDSLEASGNVAEEVSATRTVPGHFFRNGGGGPSDSSDEDEAEAPVAQPRNLSWDELMEEATDAPPAAGGPSTAAAAPVAPPQPLPADGGVLQHPAATATAAAAAGVRAVPYLASHEVEEEEERAEAAKQLEPPQAVQAHPAGPPSLGPTAAAVAAALLATPPSPDRWDAASPSGAVLSSGLPNMDICAVLGGEAAAEPLSGSAGAPSAEEGSSASALAVGESVPADAFPFTREEPLAEWEWVRDGLVMAA